MAVKKKSVTEKKRKKKIDNSLFYTASVIFLVLLAMLVYRKIFTPPVEIAVVCGDYCPGPSEQYEKAIYTGVTNKLQCRFLGGKPETVTGWGTQTICLAE